MKNKSNGFVISHLLFVFFIFTSAIAQQVHPVSGEPLKYCGTDEATQELYKKYPHLKIAAEIIEQQQIEQKTNPESSANPPIYTIPVVIHILHNYGPENIPDANVKDALRIINQDFRKMNADTTQVVAAFKALVADCEIEFKLAQLDPNVAGREGLLVVLALVIVPRALAVLHDGDDVAAHVTRTAAVLD